MVIVATILALIVRLVGFGFQSNDAFWSLLPWFEQIRESGGLHALNEQVGDYGLLYQTLIAIMTYIDFPALYQIKLLSIVFDFVLAIVVAKIVSLMVGNERKYAIWAYCVTLFLPTVIINSAYWGQCDAMYTSFSLLSLAAMYRRRYTVGFIALGLAFGCKLQTVFILPFVFMLYLQRRDFSLLNFLYALASCWVTGIVAFLFGRSLLAPIEIYLYQTQEQAEMFKNFPNFWMIFGYMYSFAFVGIGLAGFICMAILVAFLNRRDFEEKFFQIVTLTVWSVVLFLPNMHDRYAYLLDILLVVLSFRDRRYIKYAVVAICISIYSYGNFVSFKKTTTDSSHLIHILLAIGYFFTYATYAYRLVTETHSGASSDSNKV